MSRSMMRHIGGAACTVLFAGMALADPAVFHPLQSVDVNGFTIDIVAADIDGDTDLDLACLQVQTDSGFDRSLVEILLNDGAGHFARGQSLDLGVAGSGSSSR